MTMREAKDGVVESTKTIPRSQRNEKSRHAKIGSFDEVGVVAAVWLLLSVGSNHSMHVGCWSFPINRPVVVLTRGPVQLHRTVSREMVGGVWFFDKTPTKNGFNCESPFANCPTVVHLHGNNDFTEDDSTSNDKNYDDNSGDMESIDELDRLPFFANFNYFNNNEEPPLLLSVPTVSTKNADDDTLSSLTIMESVNSDAPVDSTQSGGVESTASSFTTGRSSHLETNCSLASMWQSRRALFQMTRPNNIPGVILFHMLGVYLALGGAALETSAHAIVGASPASSYWSILLRSPALWVSLFSITLVSASSMVVNDYYDFKLGRDSEKENANKLLMSSLQDNNNKEKTGTVTVTKPVVRLFLMYLYAAALLASNLLPGIPTRVSVTIGLMMTYLYTVHLKPMTWVKNIVCASLIALAPWTSGSCALYVLQQQQQQQLLLGAATISTAILKQTVISGVWSVPSLWRLFAVLFTGVMGREILMDCSDVKADAESGIRTVPVVYGCRRAAQVATIMTLIMTILAVAPHVSTISSLGMLLKKQKLWNMILNIEPMTATIASVPAAAAKLAVSLLRTIPLRRLGFAATGCAIQLLGTVKVVRTKGADITVIDSVIGQSLWTVVLLLASFV